MKLLHPLLAAALSCLFCTISIARADPVAALNQPAPAFALPDQDGNVVRLSDYKNKIVVLEWTSDECPFVRRHYNEKTMQTLAERYAPKRVTWIAINSSRFWTQARAQNWVQEHQIHYPVLDDHQGIVGKEYGAKTTPHMFIVDADGILVYRGAIDDDGMGDKTNRQNYVGQALDELGAGKKVSIPETIPYGCSVKYAS